MTMTSPLRGPKSTEGGGFAAAHFRARRVCYGAAPPASTVLRIPLRGTRLRRAVDPGASAGPAGLTARARPKARPDSRAANLSNLDFYKGFAIPHGKVPSTRG